MDNSLESGAKPEDDETQGGLSQVQEPRIGSGLCHPNAAQIQVEINRMMRSPFRRILADYLGFAPTPDALKRFADKSPDRWMQGLTIIAGLAGYQKEVHVSADLNVNVHSMSDADIRAKREALAQRALEVGQKLSLPLPPPTINQQGQTVSRETKAMAANRHESTRLNADASDVQYQEHPAVNPDKP